jgi:tetratricopeptide (TPR) repeat protein
MPRYPATDIPHIASTDHQIVRRAEKTPLKDGSESEPKLELFHADGAPIGSPEIDRDLGIGLANILIPLATKRHPAASRVGRQAIKLLEKAIENDTQDIKALEARAEALAMINRSEDALEAFEEILSRHPRRELSLLGAAMLAQNLDRGEWALVYWRCLVVENPWQSAHRSSLAQLLAGQRRWDEALKQAQEWRRLDPPSIEARVLIVGCLLAVGDKAGAREEFTQIERLHPPNLEKLRSQFAVHLDIR